MEAHWFSFFETTFARIFHHLSRFDRRGTSGSIAVSGKRHPSIQIAANQTEERQEIRQSLSMIPFIVLATALLGRGRLQGNAV